MTDLETFCKLEIAAARRIERATKKEPSFNMEASHKRAYAYGVIGAMSKVLIQIKQIQKDERSRTPRL